MIKIAKRDGLYPVKRKKETYFNIPIPLLNGMMENKQKTMERILQYCTYKFSLEKDFIPCEIQAYEDAFEQLGGFQNGVADDFMQGMELDNSLDERLPIAGLHKSVFWAFYDNQVTDFQLACLVAYLAVKSILGKQLYCKLNNRFLVSRMAGHVQTVEVDLLPKELRKYLGRYQSEKLRNELEANWGINTYGFRTRGFYVSIDLPMKSLIAQVEKNRKSRVEKHRLKTKQQLRKDVISELENSS
nr:hypothetical protein [uncultured Allomuricauda sp.]